jgi:hypothetical protein
MSPKFHAQSLKLHLPGRIGSALVLTSLTLYVVAMLAQTLAGPLDATRWPEALIGLLLLGTLGVPATQHTLWGEAG